jgi:peptide chain release factor 2
MHASDFWNDQNNAKKVTKQISQLREEIEHINKLDEIKGELETYIQLLDDDFNLSLFTEALSNWDEWQNFVEKMEVECLLNEKYDHNDAVFSIHAGAGGTEAQDWAEMLLRMYMRWAEKNKFDFTIIDSLDGEEAGIKSVTVEVKGNYAYGQNVPF